MRVPSNAFSRNLISQLQRLGTQQAKYQNQVATGQRITNLSDDPAAASRVMKLEQEKRQIQQYSSNQGRALLVSQSSYAAVNELRNFQVRSAELIQLGGGVSSIDANNAYAIEVDQMIEKAVQFANSKTGTDYLFGGTKTDVPPFTRNPATGTITSVTYTGSPVGSAEVAMQTSQGAMTTPFNSGADNKKLETFLNNLIKVRDALTANSQPLLNAAEVAIDSSENDLLANLSKIGAIQTGLESDTALNLARFTSLGTLTSRDADADIAETMVKLTQAQTNYQASLQSGAKMLQMSLLDYIS